MIFQDSTRVLRRISGMSVISGRRTSSAHRECLSELHWESRTSRISRRVRAYYPGCHVKWSLSFSLLPLARSTNSSSNSRLSYLVDRQEPLAEFRRICYCPASHATPALQFIALFVRRVAQRTTVVRRMKVPANYIVLTGFHPACTGWS